MCWVSVCVCVCLFIVCLSLCVRVFVWYLLNIQITFVYGMDDKQITIWQLSSLGCWISFVWPDMIFICFIYRRKWNNWNQFNTFTNDFYLRIGLACIHHDLSISAYHCSPYTVRLRWVCKVLFVCLHLDGDVWYRKGRMRCVALTCYAWCWWYANNAYVSCKNRCSDTITTFVH